jgi:hypothetical protein
VSRDEFRRQTLQAAEVALPVSLRCLILSHAVNEDFEAAGDAAVVEVKAEAAYLQRLAAALVLPGVDAGVERLEELIVARKETVFVERVVAAVNARFERRILDDNTFMDG